MKVIAIYPGRYQPWHLGHKSVYDALVRQFGVENVYIATSDKVDPPRSPFNFAEKQQIIAATGVDRNRVVQTRDPYKAIEITSQYDPRDTKLLFAVSAKDMDEDPRFKSWTRRDGSPAYFQPAPGKVSEMEDFDQHGYIFVVPTLDFKVDGRPMRSATEFRKEFAAADDTTKASMTQGILGTRDPSLVKLLASRITEGKKMKLNDVVNETTAGAIGSVVAPLGATQRRKVKEVDSKKKPTPGDVLDHARRARDYTGQKPIKESDIPPDTASPTAAAKPAAAKPAAAKPVATRPGTDKQLAAIVQVGPGFNVVKTVDGETHRRTGTRPWRNNNPGNISYGGYATSQGAIGTDGRYAIFPTAEMGMEACKNLLFGPSSKYINLSMRDAINRYAPSHENDTVRYVQDVAKITGTTPDTLLKDLTTDAAKDAFLKAIYKIEGFYAKGKIEIVADAAPAASATSAPPVSESDEQSIVPQKQIAQAWTANKAKAKMFIKAVPVAIVPAASLAKLMPPKTAAKVRQLAGQVDATSYTDEHAGKGMYIFQMKDSQPDIYIAGPDVLQKYVKYTGRLPTEPKPRSKIPSITLLDQLGLDAAQFPLYIKRVPTPMISAAELGVENKQIETSWGNQTVEKGAWITQEDNGHTYCCNPDAQGLPIGYVPATQSVSESSQRVDRLVTRSLKVMRGGSTADAVAALKTVLGEMEYNERPQFYDFFIKQMVDMYGKQGNLKEFAPGNGGGESGRWYTDDQMTDLVGDGWWNDLDISGDISKQEMIQEAQAWLDDQGYSVHVLNCKVNDDDMEWYIEGSFQNSRFAKKGVAEGGPFSYGKKAPRKGSVADLAAQKRKEQDKKTPLIEPRDQMVGNAKVTKDVKEEWSQKYKNSINCKHPKGFSQKAHCAGKRKHTESTVMEMTCPDCGMCKSHGTLSEIRKGQKDANGYTKCWPGKHAEGTKKGSNGGQVRNCVPNDGVTEDFKMKSDFRKESDAALADFLARGGEIETVPPNRVRVKPGQSLASKHIGSKRETGRIVGKDRRVHGNKPVVNVSEVNDYFKRRKDEEDRIAGVKPPAKNKKDPAKTDYQQRRNQEQQVEEAKQKPSAQERFNNRLKTKHGIDLAAMERQWAERTKKIEAEIEALRKQEQQVSESYYQFDESWKSKLAGAALAGAAAFGGAAHAGGMSLPPAGLTPAQAQEFAATQMAGQQAINQHAAQQAGKIDYRKDGPITKSSLGHKLEYGIPVNAKGDFINPNRLPNIHELPMEEQQAMSDAYKTWLKDYLSRWPDARQQPDGSMQAIKPGLAPMYPK